MIFQVVISKQAENDLRAIFEYITFELKSLQNAKRQLQRLKDKISTLNQFPERYKKMEKNPWYSFEMRSFSVDNYIVFYIVDNKKEL